MKKDDSTGNTEPSRSKQALRKQAEARLAQSPDIPEALSPEETRRELHELRVHRIELEMQNEELRRAQAELEAAHARYFDLYDLAPVGYCILSEKGLILEANLTAAILLGTGRSALVNQPLTRFILKEDQDIYYRHRKQLFETGAPQACELRLVKPDGTLFWAHLTATAAQAEDGAPVCRVVLSDIAERKRAEEVLQRIEHDLRESQRISHVGSWHLDVATDRVVWTEELYNMYGFDPSLPPPPYTEHMKLFTPESWKRLSTALARTRDTGIPYTLELETVRKDGSNGWMWVRGEADVDSAGKTVGLWGAAQDITERKRDEAQREKAREELRASEERYRNLVAHASEGIYRIEMVPPIPVALPRDELIGMINRQAVLSEVNEALASMYGLRPKDMIGRPATDFAPDYGARASLVLDGESHSVKNVETCDVDKAGNAIFLLESYHGEIEDGVLQRIWGLQHDITDRKRDEAAAKREQVLINTIIDSIPGAFYMLDAKGRYVRWNVYQRDEIIGKPEDQVAGTNALDTIHPDDRALIQEKIANVLGNGAEETVEGRVLLRGGPAFRWLLMTGRQMTIDGSPFLIGIGIDITDRKRAEEELRKMQKLQSVGTLAGGIAHDFNNILMGLFGNISLAKDELPKEHPCYTLLEEAEKSMSRAVRLTKQLLTFAKGGDPVKEVLSLGSMVEEVAHFDLSGSNTRLVYRQDEELWPAEVDKGQIQQVISNLAINARQAMPNGGRLYIALENADIPKADIPGLHPGKYVKITMRDEGIGIEQKHLGLIFDPYFTTKQTGSGLGLATAYSIVHKHGGHIGVVSELGKGTTFTLYLPASESPQRAEAPPPAAEGPAPARSARILVMDDEKTICDIIARMLKQCGFTVATALDGQKAIERYKQALEAGAPFDAVIMDLTIPGGIGGMEAIEDLLAIDPQARVIVSSGYAGDPVMANYAEYGFKGIAAKPYTQSELLDVLERVLK